MAAASFPFEPPHTAAALHVTAPFLYCLVALEPRRPILKFHFEAALQDAVQAFVGAVGSGVLAYKVLKFYENSAAAIVRVPQQHGDVFVGALTLSGTTPEQLPRRFSVVRSSVALSPLLDSDAVAGVPGVPSGGPPAVVESLS